MDLTTPSDVNHGSSPTFSYKNVSKRISVQRIVTSLLIVSLICQLPFVWLAPKEMQLAVLLNLIISVAVFSIVICLTNTKTFAIARFLLISTFTVFIGYSCWLWRADHHTQWFLLLGIVIVTYLFSPKEKAWLFASYFAFAIVFLGFELYFLALSNDRIFAPVNAIPYGAKSISNAFFMVLACIGVALNIRRFMDGHWQSICDRSTRLQSTLDRVFPAMFLPNNDKQEAQTQCYYGVSVLFVDMSSYSEFTATQPIQKHIELLHQAYTLFDQILSDNGIVRIKTNGDQYIAAIGIPYTETESATVYNMPEHADRRAIQLCRAASQIQQSFHHVCKAFEFKSQLKMGIASGNVTAGFIGTLRPTFDVWGEPMIVASRLERNCARNDILLCPNTHFLIRDSEIKTEFDGEHCLKGLTQLKIYRILAFQPE